MQTVTVQKLLHNQIDNTLGHLIYVVRDHDLIFYIGQSKRDITARFSEHVQKPTRLGQLIALNRPDSFTWSVDFYTLADCRPFVAQKSLFAMQAWEHFDMDMAEQGLIQSLQPVLNRDFNAHPTPLPAIYAGQHLAPQPQTDLHAPELQPWLNRMSLDGWVYEMDANGRLTWHHSDGRTMTDNEIAPFRSNNRVP